ncbi:hypothetical protein Ferp_0516 [Ferroglobus placidus DSM 10642]|uniref:Uncharacterized protein n=1 Tax=Ferroglobus placidus (strain DSM 10642 / AEDII12DO) TaxID=589924 RepID=D3S357_FERPA|nr:hypothetical protein [Ferroglobus placidus]ADC64690.1 hypothetical protein Ferp_0516 [Ferroglobus placidus DSM 10642]
MLGWLIGKGESKARGKERGKKNRKRELGKIKFNKILDRISAEVQELRDEWMDVVEDCDEDREEEEWEELLKKIKEIEEKYSEKTGFNIRVKVNREGNAMSIWINDLRFDYEFVDILEEYEEKEEVEVEDGGALTGEVKREQTEVLPSRDVMYV